MSVIYPFVLYNKIPSINATVTPPPTSILTPLAPFFETIRGVLFK